MHSKPLPAIQRDYCETDAEIEIMSTFYDSVTFERGLGDIGLKIQYVEHDCPICGADRMIRTVDVQPELRNRAKYWCTKPTCPHFVGDQFSFAQSITPTEIPVKE